MLYSMNKNEKLLNQGFDCINNGDIPCAKRVLDELKQKEDTPYLKFIISQLLLEIGYKNREIEHLDEAITNLEEIEEYSFDDCKSISKLFFDFALFIQGKMILIEVDGQYHFKDYYGNLDEQLKRDEIKNRYCNKHNIPLIRIPYWEYKKDNYKNILDKEINKYIIESA